MSELSSRKMFSFLGLFTLLLALASPAAAQTWTKLAPSGSPPQYRCYGASPVSDPATQRMILFGGNSCAGFVLNDTWILTNANGLGGAPQWINLIPNGASGSPVARANHSAVYDSASNRMIIYGGCTGGCLPIANDVWVLTNANGLGGTPSWIPLSPAGTAPQGRQSHRALYDSANNRMIVFGGQDGGGSTSTIFLETWVLTNANGLGGTPTWIQLTPSGGPPPAEYISTAVYDRAGNQMTVFGGITRPGVTENAVWVLSNANGLGGTPVWSNTVANGASGSPSARAGSVSGYDPGSNRMTIFDGGGLLDTWVLNHANGLGGGSSWTRLFPLGGPPGSPQNTAVFDAANNRLSVFVNSNITASSNETWVLSDANGVVTPTLSSISVSPTSPTINVGQTQQFTATGTFSDGSSRVLTAGGGTWATKASMPSVRVPNAVTGVNGLLYAVGGSDYVCNSYSTLEAYDPLTNAWTARPSMPTARWSLATGVINGILYAVGGTNGCFTPASGLTQVEAYDPVANSWTSKAPMQMRRSNFGVGVVNGILYAMGGNDNNRGVDATLEAYNPATNTWTTKAPMPTARLSFGVGVVNGILYALGGSNSTSILASVDAYDPATDSWTTKASMPAARTGLAVEVVNGILYAVGGSSTGDNFGAALLAYDPVSNTWTTKAPMPSGRTGLTAGVVNGILYAVGGVDRTNNPVATVEAYAPAEASWSSSKPAVAAIDANGLSTASSPGTTTVTATSGSVNGTATLTVAGANRPPVANAGPNQTVEATGPSGAVVTLDGSASSDPDGDTLSYNWTGSFGSISGVSPTVTFALGTQTATLTVSDGQATATGRVSITVRDSTPPVLTLPADFSSEASSAAGAVAYFTATATDSVNPRNPHVDCTPASGSTFALGSTTVNCSASDAAGNGSHGSFKITVVDTTPPILSVPGPITVYATSAADANVFYATSAVDLVDPAPGVFCLPASGAHFSLGTTTVFCSATDSAGNRAMASFMVRVIDSEAPVLHVPADITASATGPGGAVVTYSVTASDAFDPNPDVQCAPVSGSNFALGTTLVSCTARDASGNGSLASFRVKVLDDRPPVLTVPTPITVNATSPAGAVVTFTATATDAVDASPQVTCVPPSGSTFAAGNNTVNCTASDHSGNSTSASFTIHVRGSRELLNMLIAAVGDSGPGNSLQAKLRVVSTRLDVNDVSGACSGLDSFINEVRAQSGKKLSAAQAAGFIDAARGIKTALGC